MIFQFIHKLLLRLVFVNRGILGQQILVAYLARNGYLVSRALDLSCLSVDIRIVELTAENINLYNECSLWVFIL